FLTRAGLDIDVVDFDNIEIHNLGGQMYAKGQVGFNKAQAVQHMCDLLSDGKVYPLVAEFNKDFVDISPYVFSCVDNMEARKLAFFKWLEQPEHSALKVEPIFIDGRMLAEDGQVFALRLSDKEALEEYKSKYLFSDSEVAEEHCTARATSHCGALIASIMASTFFNHLTNVAMGSGLREVPFKNEFHLQLMHFIQHGSSRTVPVNADASAGEGGSMEVSPSSPLSDDQDISTIRAIE